MQISCRLFEESFLTQGESYSYAIEFNKENESNSLENHHSKIVALDSFFNFLTIVSLSRKLVKTNM